MRGMYASIASLIIVMIFDSIRAKQLYIEYKTTHDARILDALHSLASDLIKAIASSFDRSYYDDLVQEGHFKFHKLITDLRYNPDNPAAMYTFMSRVIRHHMIDYLRKTEDHLDIDSICIACSGSIAQVYNPSQQDELFLNYYNKRFPSLPHGKTSADYAKDAVLEALDRNRIINTLALENLSRVQALIVYRSVLLFLRLTAISEVPELALTESLNYAHNGKEFTLYPESVLIGCDSVNWKVLIEHVSSLRTIR